jgi:ferritin
MVDALNGQVNRELYSSYLYRSMSSFFESQMMRGFASWMRVQAAEELIHAMKMYDYVIAAGGRALMLPVEAPPAEWASPAGVFENVLSHEKAVTGLIKGLVQVAVEENDAATKNFLQWYIDEQVEEEESAEAVLTKVRAAGSETRALQAADREVGARRFKFPRGYTIFEGAAQGATVGSMKK